MKHEDSCSFSAVWGCRCYWPPGLWGRGHPQVCHRSSGRTGIWSWQKPLSELRWSETVDQSKRVKQFHHPLFFSKQKASFIYQDIKHFDMQTRNCNLVPLYTALCWWQKSLSYHLCLDVHPCVCACKAQNTNNTQTCSSKHYSVAPPLIKNSNASLDYMHELNKTCKCGALPLCLWFVFQK